MNTRKRHKVASNDDDLVKYDISWIRNSLPYSELYDLSKNGVSHILGSIDYYDSDMYPYCEFPTEAESTNRL